LLDQLKTAILKLYVGDEAAANILERWVASAEESSKASSSRSRDVEAQLTACDDKMERLLDLDIAREIESEEYRRKKGKLLNENQVLKERQADLEKGSGGWLEPAKAFLTTCNQAHSVARRENPSTQKAFLRNLGSNFVLKDQTLSLSYTSPFDLVAQTDPTKNWLPQRDDFRNFLVSEECAEMAQLVANLA
jgi:hypothetical protein